MDKNNDFKEEMLLNNQYLIIKKIGEGGFGVVWKAYDYSLKNFIAIKELLKEYSEPKFIEMFYKEALISKNIIHDNVVRVQHFWQANNGSYFISMDYVSGKDLEHLLDRCNKKNSKLPWELKFPWELAVLICSNVLKALDYANRLAKDPVTGKPYGLVYRDISPGNILISFDGSVKLGDFGIAKTAEELSLGSKQKIVTGKYGYMSPEQSKGDASIDHRSDIFSTGVVLYEMLTGQKLFTGDTKAMKAQVQDIKFDQSQFKTVNIPEELVEIVAKSLERDRDNRYEKAIEMFRDLRRMLKGKETEEFAMELGNLASNVLSEELAAENEVLEKVRGVNLQDVKSNPEIKKIICKDFIVGESSTDDSSEEYSENVQEPLVKDEPLVIRKTQEKALSEPRLKSVEHDISSDVHKGEEKGKTVFEEVGDWLSTKFKSYKRKIIRGAIAFIISIVLSVSIDVYFQITPMGKSIFSKVYPPDVVITTVPRGAMVSMRSRDGVSVLSNVSSENPIELRKIPSKTYILSAEKLGFRPVERIVKIEEVEKGRKNKTEQRIEVFFDFPVVINSEPPGAEVYINGNKFKEAPWKGELTAGEHTVRLVLPGFEDLGSMANEVRKGQCNIDFTREKQELMFNGVDKNFWTYEIIDTGDGKVFNITGYLYKNIKLNSNPKNLLVHVHNESKPRGNTPLTVALRAGQYKLRFLDSEGKYEESTRLVNVDMSTSDSMFVILNKWVTIKVFSKDQTEQDFKTNVKLKGHDLNITKAISSTYPLRIALPPDNYDISFYGNDDFKPLLLKNVDISVTSLINGELEVAVLPTKVIVQESFSEIPIRDAYVWIENKLVGKTNKNGLWENELKPGSITIKIVAKGYNEKNITMEIKGGDKNEIFVSLDPEGVLKVEKSTETYQTTTNIPLKKEDVIDIKANIITCPNCSKKYRVPPGGKSPRFCTNCGKPFR